MVGSTERHGGERGEGGGAHGHQGGRGGDGEGGCCVGNNEAGGAERPRRERPRRRLILLCESESARESATERERVAEGGPDLTKDGRSSRSSGHDDIENAKESGGHTLQVLGLARAAWLVITGAPFPLFAAQPAALPSQRPPLATEAVSRARWPARS